MSKNTITINTQHGDMIHDVAMDYYGKMLATGSSDNIIRIYNIGNGTSELVCEIAEHSGPVWRIAWSHPKFGSLLASCSYDGTIKVFNIAKDKSYSIVYKYTGHKASAWSPYEYGLCLAATSSDDDSEWKCQQIPVCRVGCSSLSWCPYRPGSMEGAIVLRLAIGAGDSCIHILKGLNTPSNSWELETKLRNHTDRIRDVSWCPFIGLPSNRIASCGRDCMLCIWDKSNGEDWKVCHSKLYNEPVWRVSWSVTGNLLTVSHGMDSVDMWKEMIDGTWKLVNMKSA